MRLIQMPHHFRLRAAIQELRPYQWVKNILLFVPLVLAQEFTDIGKIVSATLAFIAFSVCASSVYLLNDLLDIEADRRHPDKRYRPFAAGTLPLAAGPPMVLGLLVLGFSLSIAALPWDFVGALLLYLILTSAYTFWLKRKVIVDVLMLASFYTIRIISGGSAVDVPVSEWLMAFSVFLFTSLGFIKRYTELTRLAEEGNHTAERRGYFVTDFSLIENMGLTSGYLAILVLSLYFNSTDVKQLYTNVWPLWLVCLLILYWISRVWLLAKRRHLAEDPIVFAFKDHISLLVGFFVGILMIVATCI